MLNWYSSQASENAASCPGFFIAKIAAAIFTAWGLPFRACREISAANSSHSSRARPYIWLSVSVGP